MFQNKAKLVEYVVLLIALVALGFSIISVVKPCKKSDFADTCNPCSCPTYGENECPDGTTCDCSDEAQKKCPGRGYGSCETGQKPGPKPPVVNCNRYKNQSQCINTNPICQWVENKCIYPSHPGNNCSGMGDPCGPDYNKKCCTRDKASGNVLKCIGSPDGVCAKDPSPPSPTPCDQVSCLSDEDCAEVACGECKNSICQEFNPSTAPTPAPIPYPTPTPVGPIPKPVIPRPPFNPNTGGISAGGNSSPPSPSPSPPPTPGGKGGNKNLKLIISGSVGAIVVLLAIITFIFMKLKRKI